MNRTRPRRAPRHRGHHNRKSDCPSRKVAYLTFGTAVAGALRVSRHVGPVRVYQCPYCGRWHLTRLREWKDPT